MPVSTRDSTVYKQYGNHLSVLFCLWVNSLKDETLLKLLASIQGSFQGFIPGHSMARANLNKSKFSFLDFYHHSIKVHKEIGDEEPYYSTKILIFSFIWAGLPALHKASTI